LKNDYDTVESKSFVHSLDLINTAWKMDEFQLDDVETVASEIDHGDE